MAKNESKVDVVALKQVEEKDPLPPEHAATFEPATLRVPASSQGRAVYEMTKVDVDSIAQALAAPFDPAEVKFKPQTVSGNRALAVAFVDARVIQDRLDDVLGVMGWQDSYECLPDGAVVCRLRIRLGNEWITKEDVGGQSEQPDEGDRRKSAFSDALKRAAVKFGIGRYLYRLKPQWVDYDPQKRQLLRTPTLPLPHPVAPVAVRATEAAPAGAAKNGTAPEKKANKAKPLAASAESTPAPAHRSIPANGEELQRRLKDFDERLARQGKCKPGDLVKHILSAGVKAGYEKDLTAWSGPAIQLAIDEAKAFEKTCLPRAQSGQAEPRRKEVA
jgi:hypothetical protein